MKKILLKSTLWLILFVLANLYFALFNWQIFTVNLNVNLGFGAVEFPPFIVLFLVAFVLIGILSWVNYNIRLQKMIYDLEHGVEMGKLKDRLDSNRIQKLLFNEQNMKLMKEKLGMAELVKKQEELALSIDELKRRSDKEKQ